MAAGSPPVRPTASGKVKRRLLIVGGDDFGASAEVNEAVILAHRRGILTSCSLMPAGAAFGDAVRLARENPELAVGIHLTCVAGKSVLPHSEIPRLVDGDGNFPSDPAYAGLKYFFCKRARKELFKEITAQFEKCCLSGVRLSHIDGHCHLHVHPVVFGAALEIGQACGIRRMRVPEDDFFAAAPYLDSPFGKAGYALVFKLLARSMKARLRERGFGFPLKVFGNFLSGAMSGEYVLALLDRTPAGVSEVYFHPARVAAPRPADRERAQPLRELLVLLDPEVRAKMERLEIKPATYFDLDKV